jgi:hypothetical protein
MIINIQICNFFRQPFTFQLRFINFCELWQVSVNNFFFGPTPLLAGGWSFPE